MSSDNPVAKAAEAIKQIHQENVALIDGGHIFTRDGVDVSGEIRALSLEQIELCDMIIARAPEAEELSAKNAMSLADVIHEIEEIKAKRALPGEAPGEELPEIGNYGHQA